MATETGPEGPARVGSGAGNLAAGGASQREAIKAMQRYLHDHWKYYAFQGALMIVVGLLALLVPFAATLATTLFFGWLLILGGIVGCVAAFRAKEAPGFWSSLLLAVLSAVLGAVIIYDPLAGTVTLTWLLAVFFFLSGLFNFSIARAVRLSTTRFWLVVVSGIIDVALAVFLILGLPGTAIWAIGVFLGISFITSGFGLLFSALDARNNPPASRV
ncbi:HdeD family acid-resistance protein [Jiella avicenniae]|uniref:HdeD family acid-resistance protein n=1 Tax=Jiella avicenniae TaxID=2907202 RepID=A0A9X1T7B0_9HYPH|nr:HdeD family acid-resistance protein [Jiella avicenniae]MCE7030220.1 HdeD family acid-resistance protein [Jiella avicenniae]